MVAAYTVPVTFVVKAESPEDAMRLVQERLFDHVARWYAETTHEDVIKGQGYPRGSLIFFNFNEGKVWK